MTNTTIGGSSGLVSQGVGQPVRLVHIELDISDVAATVTTGGLVKYILPANTYFQFLYAEVVTALAIDSGSSQRVDIGDESDDDQYVSNHTTTTAGTAMTVVTPTHTDGLVTGAADFLAVKLTGDKLAGGTANGTGIIRMVVLVGDAQRIAQMGIPTT